MQKMSPEENQELAIPAVRLERGSPRTARRKKNCNLCGALFRPATAHTCFCDDCRENDDLYRFHDWLPDLSVA